MKLRKTMHMRIMVLIDGENLVFRYQSMLEAGRMPRDQVLHIPDAFVWHHYLLGFPIPDEALRVVYYTSAVGDTARINEVGDEIQKARFATGTPQAFVWRSLRASVFKKDRASRKTKTIDMRMCIDALVHTMNSNMDELYLVSGDGDFLPLIEEVMRHGIRVRLFALSDGCADEIKRSGDSFEFVDAGLLQMND